ncbi:hypothetical protein [Frateuria soli]|uniref:hypothetical protein n=1 Tax=Frateuria soli TaxID=1542730 RepID=UPI001E562315|nr:hypothetical protein [Frateuria soli]UGB37212.1 hypothetical protein LQ771_10235 [Frateuria soli]
MNKLLIATATALGLASVVGVSIAQEQAQTTQLQNVVVTAFPDSYETYVADLHTGYKLQALVGNTHRHYMQALRKADRSEALRLQGFTQQPVVSVAIDNSSGAGVARQIQLIDANRETVAIVNVYCKRAVPSGGPHCQLAPRTLRASGASGRVASIGMETLQLAQVQPRR